MRMRDFQLGRLKSMIIILGDLYILIGVELFDIVRDICATWKFNTWILVVI